MSVWYAIPSASVERANACLAAWYERGYGTAVWIDPGAPRPLANVVIEEKYPGYFVAVNRLANMLVLDWQVEIVVAGGDDIYPDKRSAAELEAEYRREFPDLDGVMQPIGDLLPGTDHICGSPWLGREWIVRAYGGTGPLHSGYMQFYGDEELLHVATRLDRLVQRPDITQRHEHWTRHGAAMKTPYQVANDRWWSQDRALFETRRAAGYPGSEWS